MDFDQEGREDEKGLIFWFPEGRGFAGKVGKLKFSSKISFIITIINGMLYGCGYYCSFYGSFASDSR
jgi:hypothetical protein